ncbi:dolichyl-P-Man:Man(5)GlcNAc(2)-PP-dolichol alpha-1,3-mannosyltransferase [Entomortierella beljakovae]|nr:dolichyl-P-Man:Man(5)GlcNAc(2)-PP-dolichol alpha-1,3-mannosyltransferase [Entomortierella beljakovae]
MAIKKRTQQHGTVSSQSTSFTASSTQSRILNEKPVPALSIFRPIQLVTELLTNHAHFWIMAGLLFLAEILLNIVIIKKIPYTEIDWIAYMQEVSGYLKGETNYMNLRGDTGPLVYPAGFVYIYSGFYYITDLGKNVLKGQWIFMGLYLLNLVVVFAIYSKDKSIPPYVLIPLCLSKRLHSIYVLRLFNDPVAMFFLYAAILAFLYRRWTLSSALFSLAISIKMNILLYFPAFGFLIWQTQGIFGTIAQLVVIVLIQVILSLPFTLTYPESYLRKAFEFSRVFEYKWTVNWKFLDEKTFLSQDLAKLLLASHFIVLFAFVFLRWSRSEGGIVQVTRLPIVIRFLLLGCIEWSWNVFPATSQSSGVLVGCHLVILAGLWIGKAKERQL